MVADLSPTTGGDEAAWMGHIREASRLIEEAFHAPFIPYAEIKHFDGSGERMLKLTTPLLEITGTIMNWTTALTSADYLPTPCDRMWPNGPYTCFETAPLAPHMAVWLEFKDGVVVPGLWGLSEEIIDTGVTVQNTTKQAAADKTLLVADGSKLSAGMVLFLDSLEQELITATGAPTAGVTTLSQAMGVADDVLTPANVAAANVGEMIRVDFEKMKIVDINTTQWSVYRNWNKTKAAAHLAAANVDVYRTFTVSRGVNGTTPADHLNGVEIFRYVPPADIGLLAKACAALAKKLADSQYAGRTGDAQLGQVFYNDVVNKAQLEQAQENYQWK
jgi:hypothetical protein